MNKTPKVLFLSRGNASRGQIAEGFLRTLAGGRVIPASAGTDVAGVSPLATEVMSEVGIDISTQQLREIPSLFKDTFHYVVTLCDEPREHHPVYPFTRNVIAWSVSDPEFATGASRKEAFRQVRDQIKGRVEELIETVNQPDSPLAKFHGRAA
jgi:arsenate reductase (thioredoxin)